jgi:hypothetical protein
MNFKQIAPYLAALDAHNHLQAWIIEMLYRDMMTVGEIAQRLKISPAQVTAQEVLAMRKLLVIAIAGPSLVMADSKPTTRPANKARVVGSKQRRAAGPSKTSG